MEMGGGVAAAASVCSVAYFTYIQSIKFTFRCCGLFYVGDY